MDGEIGAVGGVVLITLVWMVIIVVGGFIMGFVNFCANEFYNLTFKRWVYDELVAISLKKYRTTSPRKWRILLQKGLVTEGCCHGINRSGFDHMIKGMMKRVVKSDLTGLWEAEASAMSAGLIDLCPIPNKPEKSRIRITPKGWKHLGFVGEPKNIAQSYQ